MKHRDIGVDRTCLGPAALHTFLFTFSFTASLRFPSAGTNTVKRTVALAFLASFTCLKSVSAAQNLFARQDCETLFCFDNLWKPFGAFFDDSFGPTPELPTLPDTWKITEPPPSKEPDIEIQTVAPQPEHDRCSALAPDEFYSQNPPVSS